MKSQLVVVATMAVVVWTKTLLDLEIEETENLIALYQQRISLLEEYNSLNHSNNSDFARMSPSQLDYLVHLNSDQASIDRQAEEARTTTISMIEKHVVVEEEKVKFYEFLTVKPITRASNGQLISNAIVTVFENGNIKVSDIYGGVISLIETNQTFIALSCAPSQDDMFFALITDHNELHIYSIVLEKKFESQGKKGKRDGEEDSNETNAMQTNKKYKDMLKLYEYIVQPVQVVPLLNHSKSDLSVNFQHLIIYQTKGEKYFVVADSVGYIYTFRRDGTFRSRFFSGFNSIHKLIKTFVNVMFLAENKLGFIRISENKIGQILCDGGQYKFNSVALDTLITSQLYIGTDQGDILVFESYNSNLRSESLDCKLLGKVPTLASRQSLSTSYPAFDLQGVKGSIIAHHQNGLFEIFNTSDFNSFLSEENPPFTYEPKENEQAVMKTPAMPEAKLPNGNLLLVKDQVEGKDRLILYECIVPYFRPDSIFDQFNFKIPMFAVAFIVVIFWQFYYKKDEGDQFDSSDGELVRRMGKGSNLSQQQKKELNELEKMMGEIGSLKDAFKKN